MHLSFSVSISKHIGLNDNTGKEWNCLCTPEDSLLPGILRDKYQHSVPLPEGNGWKDGTKRGGNLSPVVLRTHSWRKKLFNEVTQNRHLSSQKTNNKTNTQPQLTPHEDPLLLIKLKATGSIQCRNIEFSSKDCSPLESQLVKKQGKKETRPHWWMTWSTLNCNRWCNFSFSGRLSLLSPYWYLCLLEITLRRLIYEYKNWKLLNTR